MKESIVLSASWLNLILVTVIPLLTGIVTKQVASSRVKAICTAVLSTVGGIFAAAQAADGKILLEPAAMSVFVTFVGSIGFYYGFLKPTGAAGTVQAKTANVGIG